MGDSGPGLTVLVADGQALFAQALGRVLERRHGLVVLDRHPRSGMEVVRVAVAQRPDVVVLDLWLEGITGLAATHSIVAKAPGSRVVVLGWFHGAEEIAQALGAGAAGWVSKGLGVADVADTIQLVGAGKRALTDPNYRVATGAAAPPPSSEEAEPRTEALTPRQLEVLRLLGAGLPLEDVAVRLGLRAKTVRNHLTHILAKTGTRSQLQAVMQARARGWLV